VIVKTIRGTIEECSVNTDMIIMIEPWQTEKIGIFDYKIYHTRVWLNLDEKITKTTGPIDGRNFCIPVEYELVEKYFNNEVTFEEIKNYKIPKVEAPEHLEEWIKMIWFDQLSITALKILMKNGVTTKTQLLNMTWDQVVQLRGIGKKTQSALNKRLDDFGLKLRDWWKGEET
jgi:hypothetical protein